ncbi:MAG TPA: DnaJ domain-containing protein [Ktedonobacteraceae bacterium]|jgi:hypothetical protein
MDTSNDYYAVLGVDSQASVGVIRAAFKKLALQYHPDIYKGPDAQERMRGLLQAYQTLSNPEARQAYDARRRGGQRTDGSALSRERSAGRPGRYAFPDIRQGTPLAFSLEGRTYQLAATRAENLKWDGFVRGQAAGATEGLSTCQRCLQSWPTPAAAPTARCPNCHASDWDEYLLLRCTHCRAVFSSPDIRDPLHGNTLYYPYELFPLCPNCRRSQWCPAENLRLHARRAAQARRNALVWSGAIGVCLLLLILLALAVLR